MSFTKSDSDARKEHPETKARQEEYRSEYRGFDEEAAASIHRLASRLSQEYSREGSNPMVDSSDPILDPNSPEFSSEAWVRNMKKIISSDAAHYKPSTMGVAFKNLRAFGNMADADYQTTVANGVAKYVASALRRFRKVDNTLQFDILKPMDGLISPGEVTVVLGRPGAGCSTFLKTISCNTYGYEVDNTSFISYDGLSDDEVRTNLRGEVVYCAETEHHFPNLTVGQTLEFVAKLRTPQNRPHGVSREQYARHMTDVIMATYGLSHVRDLKVGNDYIRGCSGGERKRVLIAEVALSSASLQCWDNSTRGLDAATALEFIRSLKTSATVMGDTPLIAIYQCSQEAYDLFDKVLILYEGYQIFFGPAQRAKEYFEAMGFECPDRQTTADFLTSITNPAERKVRTGFENSVPKLPEEFYSYWQASPERACLLKDIDEYIATSNNKQQILASHNARQSNHISAKSSYTVSFAMQVRYNIERNIQRIRGDPSIPVFTVIANSICGLVISSAFYNLKSTTDSFFYRTAVMFFAVLYNAYASVLEVFSLYEARPIVEKHKQYALYKPSAEALASLITDMPVKVATAITLNLVIYFMVNFNRTPGAFFFYLLVNFTGTLAMSHIFRTIGASTKSIAASMTPAALVLLLLTIFTGFAVPTPNMLGWCRWINYIDPIAYAFDALIANEYHGREFECLQYIPAGPGYPTSGNSVSCSVVGARAGQLTVLGDDYIYLSYRYSFAKRWRNWGIVVAFAAFFLLVYLFIVENSKSSMQKGEVLVFQKSTLKRMKKLNKQKPDLEAGGVDKLIELEKAAQNEGLVSDSSEFMENNLLKAYDVFHWKDLTYTIKIKGEHRTILNNVDGWVRPGEITALMGATGAGKTTLLNALSERLTVGTITSGERLVNGRPLDSSFQRSIGYVQQQDLHLETSTVREALRFSAYLRQPRSVSKAEKDKYVEYLISFLEMENFANAVVGVPGEGLNVEQRKRLTIGVELAAKPKLLLFLDEPTSGLDSQTAWSICKLIRKLADHGQAVLCTIHQPSAVLMEQFDRLLFLQKGGQTVYFGGLGENFSTLVNYFESNGASKCPKNANPAEWMLHVIGAAPGSHANQNYHEVWLRSPEYQAVRAELDNLSSEKVNLLQEEPKHDKFASSIFLQYIMVSQRLFQQYWRSPSYVYGKITMAILSAAFNGFTFFKSNNTMQGLQNQMLSMFMLYIILSTLIQQYLPIFIVQRELYEARERQSRTFSWVAFICAQITVEIPFQVVAATLTFFCWYYPVGFYRNAALQGQTHQRGALMWITLVLTFVYSSTLGQIAISFNELKDNAANLVSLVFTLCLVFCGVLAGPTFLPGFWIFMYRCNPLTYLVSVMLSIGLAGAPVTCSEKEYVRFSPPDGLTCGSYMQPYLSMAVGYLKDSNSTTVCEYCQMSNADQFLGSLNANYSYVGRNIGIFIGFIAFDMIGTVFFYWLTRVPKGSRQKKSKDRG